MYLHCKYINVYVLISPLLYYLHIIAYRSIIISRVIALDLMKKPPPLTNSYPSSTHILFSVLSSSSLPIGTYMYSV